MVAGPHAPYFQSQRQARYLAVAERLVADGQAYYCDCTPEELKASARESRIQVRADLSAPAGG